MIGLPYRTGHPLLVSSTQSLSGVPVAVPMYKYATTKGVTRVVLPIPTKTPLPSPIINKAPTVRHGWVSPPRTPTRTTVTTIHTHPFVSPPKTPTRTTVTAITTPPTTVKIPVQTSHPLSIVSMMPTAKIGGIGGGKKKPPTPTPTQQTVSNNGGLIGIATFLGLGLL